MILRIEGHHLPGANCGPHRDVHVGLQVRGQPEDLISGAADGGSWKTEISVHEGPDFRGPAVQGRKGDRFIYLTWGEGAGDAFTMFRRAKLMLADVPDPGAERVTVRVHLTDEAGMPRCARLRAAALEWS